MKMLIHDLNAEQMKIVFPKGTGDMRVIGKGDKVHACIGCRSCWIKMPGECPIHDKAGRIGVELSSTDELLLLSACTYGGLSPFVKKAADRMAPYLTPFMEASENETRFKYRYGGRFNIKVLYYNCEDEEEQETAGEYAKRLGKILGSSSVSVTFCSEEELPVLASEVIL